MKRVKVFVAVVVGVGAFLIMVTLAKVMMEKRKKKSEKK
jgi:NADH:ubiquinone oxidoreductase subunit 3 (subunit A)